MDKLMELNERNVLIVKHLGLVEKLAKGLKQRLPATITYDELFLAGCFTLVYITSDFDETKASFETFASKKIIGGMIDFVRRENRLINRNNEWIKVVEYVPLDYEDETLVYSHKDTFEEIIEGIPESGKQLLRWYYVDRLTYEEIANKIKADSKTKVKRILSTYRDMVKETYSL
jgi:RNA polymerase sigma factor (sigma-70 family)